MSVGARGRARREGDASEGSLSSQGFWLVEERGEGLEGVRSAAAVK